MAEVSSYGDSKEADASTMNSGRLVPLKTAQETSARDSLLTVYITSVPAKRASTVLRSVYYLSLQSLPCTHSLSTSLVRKLIPDDGGYDLQHVRRFAKQNDVPDFVRASIREKRAQVGQRDDVGIPPELFLLVGATTAISLDDLQAALSAVLDPLSLCSIHIPLLAPTSHEQAVSWSAKYWPTVYKKSNPFGPHPSIISRAEDELREDIYRWMNLASQVACQSASTGVGEEIGVVVVERKGGVPRPLVVAGDARWKNWPRTGSGNVTAHASLRAIAMISDGLREREETKYGTTLDSSPSSHSIFRDQPLGPLEEEHYKPTAWVDGYLCHDLELYITHEPCVMCSMAIVHSRFGRVIFQHRMEETGGLCADNKLGHGLFWRKELNWSLLAWQWRPSSDQNEAFEVSQGSGGVRLNLDA